METEVQTKEKSLAFWLVVLAALVAGVVGIFAMLERVIPAGFESSEGAWSAVYSKEDGPTAYSVRRMGEKDRKSGDITRWLTASGDYIAQNLDGDSRDAAFWLYRQDSDEYVLYLPEQDRTLAAADLSANEEKDNDGSVRLVLRIRTPEQAEEVEPKEQLLTFMTTSEKWNGIRLSVILDGREQDVNIMTSVGEELFTAEQNYIGRK